MQEGNGELVDSWRLVSASEERLLLHQFLRFDETRAMAQHLIIQHALQQLIAHHHSAAHLRPTSLHPAAAAAAAVVHDSRHHQGDLRSLTQLRLPADPPGAAPNRGRSLISETQITHTIIERDVTSRGARLRRGGAATKRRQWTCTSRGRSGRDR